MIQNEQKILAHIARAEELLQKQDLHDLAFGGKYHPYQRPGRDMFQEGYQKVDMKPKEEDSSEDLSKTLSQLLLNDKIMILKNSNGHMLLMKLDADRSLWLGVQNTTGLWEFLNVYKSWKNTHRIPSTTELEKDISTIEISRDYMLRAAEFSTSVFGYAPENLVRELAPDMHKKGEMHRYASVLDEFDEFYKNSKNTEQFVIDAFPSVYIYFNKILPRLNSYRMEHNMSNIDTDDAYKITKRMEWLRRTILSYEESRIIEDESLMNVLNYLRRLGIIEVQIVHQEENVELRSMGLSLDDDIRFIVCDLIPTALGEIVSKYDATRGTTVETEININAYAFDVSDNKYCEPIMCDIINECCNVHVNINISYTSAEMFM